MKTILKLSVVSLSLLAGVFAFAPAAAHAAPATAQPTRTYVVNGMTVRVYDRATIAKLPGVTLVKTPSSALVIKGSPRDVRINGDGWNGYAVGGDVYTAKFLQNGHVLCAWGSGDGQGAGPTGTTSLSLNTTLFYGSQGIAPPAFDEVYGLTYLSNETECVGVGDGLYTTYAYVVGYFAVPALQLNAAGHTSI